LNRRRDTGRQCELTAGGFGTAAATSATTDNSTAQRGCSCSRRIVVVIVVQVTRRVGDGHRLTDGLALPVHLYIQIVERITKHYEYRGHRGCSLLTHLERIEQRLGQTRFMRNLECERADESFVLRQSSRVCSHFVVGRATGRLHWRRPLRARGGVESEGTRQDAHKKAHKDRLLMKHVGAHTKFGTSDTPYLLLLISARASLYMAYKRWNSTDAESALVRVANWFFCDEW